MIRLIASDIDGTLLQNGATEIPPEIFDHIHRLEKKGVLFCPASGRQYTSLRRLFAPVADQVPFLCENGAVVYGPGSPEDQIRWFLGNRTAVLPAPADVPEDIIKVSAYCPKGIEAAKAALFPKWEQHFRCAVAGAVWVDFTLADKGLGISRLCEALGLRLEEVMAFGDNYNDVSMLERAGRPYLMEGAAPELRARFSARCRTVAEVLETL